MTWIMDKWDRPKGRGLSIKVKSLIESRRSRFQQIDVYESECFGKVLVLDGVIHATEFDEFAYHEMLVHVPMHSHPDPRKVLVIGGGDGGCVREVIKHRSVQEVHLCEIDNDVIELSKKHLRGMSEGLDNEKVKIFIQDGSVFVKEHPDTYDVIIVDSSDPIGPAEVLFGEQFYRGMHDALKKGGIISTQSESMFYDRDLIKKMIEFNRKIFPVVSYYFTLVPTYPSGTIGFSFCSKKHHPVRDKRRCELKLKYYNSEVHDAAFALPNLMKDVIGKDG